MSRPRGEEAIVDVRWALERTTLRGCIRGGNAAHLDLGKSGRSSVT